MKADAKGETKGIDADTNNNNNNSNSNNNNDNETIMLRSYLRFYTMSIV
jgi:hypothetical protein